MHNQSWKYSWWDKNCVSRTLKVKHEKGI
jgi:hypothetical protein